MTPAQTRGVLLAFEGIDGSGKSTQARLLAQSLRAQGREVMLTREPTDGPWGTKIRNARFTQRLSPQAELEAFIEDRREHVATVIAPALERGAVVIVDRYYYSTAAYQGARGLDPRGLIEQNRAFAPKPDQVLLYDVTPAVSLERIKARGEGIDLFETLDALTRVRALFLSLVEPHFTVIDGSGEADHVFAQTLQNASRFI